LAFAIAAAALYAYAHSGAFEARVERYVVHQVEQGSGARVEVGTFHLSWNPLGLELDQVTVHGREPAGQAPLAQIPQLTVGLRLLSLWHRRLRLGGVLVERPRIHL